jgi:hypothetical protein
MEHRRVETKLCNVAEERRNVAEEHRNVPEELRYIPEERRSIAEKLRSAGEIQNNRGELWKTPDELSARGSTFHRNALDCLRKVGGTHEIAPAEFRISDSSSAKAVETSQVLNDTLGRPRGPRDVSAEGHAVAEGKAGSGQAEAILC